MKTYKKLTPLIRLIDDDEMVLGSESFLLRMEGWQTAQYLSAEEFLSKDDSERPGCIILDIRMPGLNGMELQSLMMEKNIDLPIIFLTGHGDIDMAVSALKKGAVDFLVKPANDERLQEAVKNAVEKNILSRQKNIEHDNMLELYEQLTEREKDIAPMVANGTANKVIAIDLDISENSVKKYRSSILEKLQVRTIVELTDFLRQIGKDSVK
ncbi:response regulator transcription factor [Turicimonas muris]|uniref:DNA-binding response regulator n=2 Tax=Turicimonas muris TaxID=1796652 RepID=A0A227KRS3_9BURK|nr:response regulator [Turicimonas muris]ANU65393.1 DNA-binding response regulator [Burkholderiales bacterium YL45]MBS4768506.1 response regulator transcription factor [Burkholderiales bacterium]OXE51200.1 DNA-binding response regulator [Turicimonas muris]QQQ96546.1 response regulator transcription factor [Turicimonas muris]